MASRKRADDDTTSVAPRKRRNKVEPDEDNVVFHGDYLTEADERAARFLIALYVGLLSVVGLAFIVSGSVVAASTTQYKWVLAIVLWIVGLIMVGLAATLRVIRKSPKVQSAILEYSVLAFVFRFFRWFL